MVSITPSVLSRDLSLDEIKELCLECGREELWERIESNPPPTPFVTDGCTMWWDEWNNVSLPEACLFHDLAYWLGGSDDDRYDADIRLFDDLCDLGLPLMAHVMFAGVRAFGLPHFKRAAEEHWGYGWNEEEWVIDE